MALNGIRPPSESDRSTIVLSAVGHDTSSAAGVVTGKEPIQLKAQRKIDEVNRTAKQIDSKNLSTGDSSRYALAEKLIRNAEKTWAEHDFAAAASLAKKASDLLAPLPRLAEASPAGR
jgi:hypothetical protein